MAIIKRLEGKRVLILLASEFDDSEFRDVAGALFLEGAEITVASTAKDVLRGLHGDEMVIPDELVHDVNVQGFTGLYIPGGKAPSKMRDDPDVQKIVQDAYKRGLQIGAVCHGPQVLISAGIVKNKTLTSHPAVGRELQEAGANYTGRSVERDGSITTATDPRALAEFNTIFIREIACCELFGP
jgi:protease I